MWQIPTETVTDLLYLPGQRHAGDPTGTAICPQAAQHIFGTSTLAGLTPAASCRQDVLMPKHPMQIQGFCRESQDQPLIHGVGFFPPKGLAPLSSQKDTPISISQNCSALSLEVLSKQSHPCSSPILQVVSAQRETSAPRRYGSLRCCMYRTLLQCTHILQSQKLLVPPAHKFWFQIIFSPLAKLHKTSIRNLPGKYLCPQNNTAAGNTKVAC